MDLKILVKDCGYTEPECMLRDAIMLNSYHMDVGEKCLDKGDDVTLEMAITIGQNHKTTRDSMCTIGVDKDLKVHSVSH